MTSSRGAGKRVSRPPKQHESFDSADGSEDERPSKRPKAPSLMATVHTAASAGVEPTHWQAMSAEQVDQKLGNGRAEQAGWLIEPIGR